MERGDPKRLRAGLDQPAVLQTEEEAAALAKVLKKVGPQMWLEILSARDIDTGNLVLTLTDVALMCRVSKTFSALCDGQHGSIWKRMYWKLTGQPAEPAPRLRWSWECRG